MIDMNGQWALVTGAASGIGGATARELASRGARLVLTDIRLDALDEVAAELRATGVEVRTVRHDVADHDQWVALAESLDADGIVPTLLVNNAGVAALGTALSLSLESWKTVIDVDLWGVIHGVRTFVPRMLDAGGRRAVLNVSSASCYVGLPMSAPYFIAKAGVWRLTQTMQAEIDPRRVSFTALCPAQVSSGIGAAGKRLGADNGAAQERLDAWLHPKGRHVSQVARKGVRGALKGRAVVNVYPEAWLLEYAMRFVPHGLGAWLNRLHFAKRFPELV